jgi:hypothetical protein
MNEKLINQFNVLFENAPKTRKALELKEELLANAEERYQDLVSDGISAEDAIKNVIKSIGNVTELFQGLDDLEEEEKFVYFEKAKKSAVYKTVAIGIYIFSAIVFLFFAMVNHMLNYWYDGGINYMWFGLIIMLLIDIAPTCMLVYQFSLYPGYIKRNDTVVEEFKEWKTKNTKTKSIKLSASMVLWSFTLFIYFAVSFTTFAWYITWIIFLVAICIQAIIELLFQLKGKSE